MVSDEDALRQKHRLPRALRNSVRNDAKLRASCPVYGTTFSGQARPLPRANKLNYVRRKQREREAKEKAKANASRSEGGDEGQAGGSARKRAQGRKNSSLSGGTLPPALAGAATTPTTAQPALTDPTTPSDERAHTPLVPQAVYYHSWSIYDPPTPAVPVDQHPPTAPAYTVPDPAYDQPPIPTGAYEQSAMGAHNSGLHVGFQAPHAATVGPSSSPDATYMVGNVYAATCPTTTHSLEIDNGSPSTPGSPPAVWSGSPDSMSATAPSAHQLDPGLLTAQYGVGHFNPVYHGFSVCSSLDSHHSTSQALAPVLSEHYADTPHPAHHGPVPQAHPTEFAAVDNAVGGTSNHGTTEKGPGDAAPVSSYVTQPAGDQSVAWPAGVGHVDREGSYDMESGVNDGHDVQIPYSPVAAPATPTYDMHPSLPAQQSSYSELAQALQFSPRMFTHDCGPCSGDGSGTAPCTTISAVPDMPLYTQSSNGGVGIHSPDPVFLTPAYPQDVVISEDECARIIRECFDYSDRLLSEISSLRLVLLSRRADFATGQGRDRTYPQNGHPAPWATQHSSS